MAKGGRVLHNYGLVTDLLGKRGESLQGQEGWGEKALYFDLRSKEKKYCRSRKKHGLLRKNVSQKNRPPAADRTELRKVPVFKEDLSKTKE